MIENMLKFEKPSDIEHIKDILNMMLLTINKPLFLKLIYEDDAKKTAQNNTFHELLKIFNNSGMHSFDSYEKMRNHYKNIAGLIAGYKYRDGNETITKKSVSEVPPEKRNIAIKELKSWSYASKTQAKEAIQILIADMRNAGVNDASFEKMLEKWEKDFLEYFGVL